MKTLESHQIFIPLTPAPPIAEEEAEEMASILKALAEPMRLKILMIVAQRGVEEVCACEFPDALGISQPTASHHLKRLTDAGMLTREQRGKWAYFRVVPDRIRKAQSLLGTLAGTD